MESLYLVLGFISVETALSALCIHISRAKPESQSQS